MSETALPKWYSIKEAAEYLDIGEPTLYRWMRDGKITYRKVGDSTRFWRADLDAVMQVFRSSAEVAKVQAVCPYCNGAELIEGHVQSTGLNYFRPKKVKFWTLKDINVETEARLCVRCGAVSWFADLKRIEELKKALAEKKSDEEKAGEPAEDRSNVL